MPPELMAAIISVGILLIAVIPIRQAAILALVGRGFPGSGSGEHCSTRPCEYG